MHTERTMNPNEKESSQSSQPSLIEGKYYRGRIAKYNPKTGYGFVETPEGTHIFFYADQVRLEGAKKRKADIHPGLLVGYDVAWTDRGIRISKLKLLENDRRSRPPKARK